MNEQEPDATRLRQRLHDLADRIHPDVNERAATAIRAGKRAARASRIFVPLAAAAATILVVGLSYAVVTGLPRGNPPAGPAQSSSTTGSPTQATSTAESPTATQTSSATKTPTTTTSGPKMVNGFAVAGREKVDVDGDGLPDRVVLLDNSDTGSPCHPCKQKLKVYLAAGGVGPLLHKWKPVAASKLLPAVDLDGDGDMEIVVGFSGGEYFSMEVFDVDQGWLDPVTTVDADGTPLGLGGTGSSTSWSSAFTTDGRLVDFEWTKADPGTPPFTVKVRTWAMTGTTLTRSDTVQKGCYDIKHYQLVLTLGACK